MKVSLDPGTERWLPWAHARLAELRKFRARVDLPSTTRAWEPEPGTQVWAQSATSGDWLRITGGAGFRGWGAFLVARLRAGAAVESRSEAVPDFYADWSQNYLAFAYTPDAGTVRVERAGVEYELPGCVATPAPPSSFYRQSNAVMASDASWVFARAAVPAIDLVGRVAVWDAQDEEYEVRAIPFPPVAVRDRIDFATMSVLTTLPGSGDIPTVQVGVPVSISLSAAPNGGGKVHAVVASGEFTSAVNLGGLAGGHVYLLTAAAAHELWEYDIASSSWSLLQTLGSETGSVGRGVPSTPSGGSGVSGGTTGAVLPVRTTRVMYDPAGAPHLLSWDGNTRGSATTSYTVFGNVDDGEPFSISIPVSHGTLTWRDHAEVYLDGTLLFENVAVDDGITSPGAVLAEHPGVISPVHLGEGGRVAVTAADATSAGGRKGTFWWWGGEWRVETVEAVKVSSSGHWLTRPDGSAYYDGADTGLAGQVALYTHPTVDGEFTRAAGAALETVRLVRTVPDSGPPTYSSTVRSSTSRTFQVDGGAVAFSADELVPDAFVI